jgi:orotate phosphoribosyltransferase
MSEVVASDRYILERSLDNGSRENLRVLVESVCLLRGQEFVLSTGARSDFYFDCKRAVLKGDSLVLIAQQFIAAADQLPKAPDAIGGLSIGADFLVAATIQLAAQRNHRMITGCIVRKDRKDHGTRTFIENEQPPGTKVMVVDDVFTSGKSAALACQRLVEVGNEIVGIVGLVDRNQGGVEYLRSQFDVPVRTVFSIQDFPALSAE